MVVSRSTFFSLSALAAASGAHASLQHPPPVYDRGAERVGDANWNKAFDLNLGGPNATSRFATFKGYDLSKPYLESESAHQWSYTVQVKDGIPLEGQEAADPEKAEFVTGTQISLWPERNVTVNNEWATPLNYSRTTGALSAEEVQARSSGGVHPSWNICQMMFTSYTLWHTEPVNAYYPHVPATPDCGNFLDSDCAQALKISLANEFNTNGTARGVNLTGIDRCPRTDMNLPESCKPKFGQVEHVPDKEFAQYSATAVLMDLNKTSSSSSSWAEPQMFAQLTSTNMNWAAMQNVEPKTHKLGDFAEYDIQIRKVYVLAHIWGYSSKLDNASPARPQVELVCLQAGVNNPESRVLAAAPGRKKAAGALLSLTAFVAFGLVLL